MYRYTMSLALCIGLAICRAAPQLNAAEPVRFNRDVRPILAANCFGCHGQGEQKAGLRLDISDIAYANGYADQSHFIRNFKKFTRLSPLEFQRQAEGRSGDFPGLIG